MFEHPIDSLVDHLTVEDIIIDLLDSKCFKSKIIEHPAQLSGDDDFNTIDPKYVSVLFPYSGGEVKRVAVCELDKQDYQDWEPISEEPFSYRVSKVITRHYEVKKKVMLLLIKIDSSGRCGKFLKNEDIVELEETEERLKSYLKKDLIDITKFSTKGNIGTMHDMMIVTFNSYTSRELK